MLAALGERAFKALRPANRDCAAGPAGAATRPAPRPPAWLVDAYRPGEYGGTGQSADWSTGAGLARSAPHLAGRRADARRTWPQAVRQVQPWGVDVASGVESAPGERMQRKWLNSSKPPGRRKKYAIEAPASPPSANSARTAGSLCPKR